MHASITMSESESLPYKQFSIAITYVQLLAFYVNICQSMKPRDLKKYIDTVYRNDP